MCGIVGVTGVKGASGVVYKRLSLLEYRGYDSAGIASLDNGKISFCKRRGRVFSLAGDLKNLHGDTAIGHTRWATHGKPSDENAHPHTAGKFSVVHNGIIENYSALKEKFFSGVKFFSETDTEIVARLLDYFYDGYIHKNPVIVGYGKNCAYTASDLSALAGLCTEISVLEDGDTAFLTKHGIEFYNSEFERTERSKRENPAQSAELNGCPHYMLKEIREVPSSIIKTADAYICTRDKIKRYLTGADRIIITGCGTAYNSGLIGKRYIESFARIPVEVETAGEFRYKQPIVTKNTVVIAISQSGETADTVEAARLVKSLGAKVIAVTNSPYSELTRIADAAVPVEAGQEICVAATKSYTGQLSALYLLALTLADKDEKEGAEALKAAADIIARTIEHTDIGTLAEACARSSGVYFIGRDLDFAVATEGSLKLKEISYVPSEGYPAGELKHGTLALIDIKTVSVCIICDKELAKKSENAVEQIISRKGKVAVITNVPETVNRLKGKAEIIEIEDCGKFLSPLLSAVIVQLLAYKTALLLDRDPDKPRNLAKSVTVE